MNNKVNKHFLDYIRQEIKNFLSFCIEKEEIKMYDCSLFIDLCAIKGTKGFELFISKRLFKEKEKICCEVSFPIPCVKSGEFNFIFIFSENGERVEKVCAIDSESEEEDISELGDEFMAIIPENLPESMAKLKPIFEEFISWKDLSKKHKRKKWLC